MRSSTTSLFVVGIVAGPETGQATAFSFVGGVIAPHLVSKSSELARLDVGIEMHIHRAWAVSVMPSLTWSTLLLAVWRPEQGANLGFALAHQSDRCRVRRLNVLG